MSSAAPTKSRATKKAAAPAAAAAPAPVAVAAPVVAAKAAVVAPAAPATVPGVAVAVLPTGDQVNIVSEFTALAEQVEQAWTYISSLRSAVKKFQKQLPREMKKASKGRRGRKVAAETAADGTVVPKKDSVFTRPTAISDALCTFLGVAKGSLVSRSSVTKQICDYAKSKGLMEKQNIKADAPLRKLFALTEKDELKILNLQRYLKSHYLKAAVPALAATKA